jgi:hypothetical protein
MKPREDDDTEEFTTLNSDGRLHVIDDSSWPSDATVSSVGSLKADTIPEPSRAAASIWRDWQEYGNVRFRDELEERLLQSAQEKISCETVADVHVLLFSCHSVKLSQEALSAQFSSPDAVMRI